MQTVKAEQGVFFLLFVCLKHLSAPNFEIQHWLVAHQSFPTPSNHWPFSIYPKVWHIEESKIWFFLLVCRFIEFQSVQNQRIYLSYRKVDSYYMQVLLPNSNSNLVVDYSEVLWASFFKYWGWSANCMKCFHLATYAEHLEGLNGHFQLRELILNLFLSLPVEPSECSKQMTWK